MCLNCCLLCALKVLVPFYTWNYKKYFSFFFLFVAWQTCINETIWRNECKWLCVWAMCCIICVPCGFHHLFVAKTFQVNSNHVWHSCTLNAWSAHPLLSCCIFIFYPSRLKSIWIFTPKYGSKLTKIQETTSGTTSNSQYIKLCRRLWKLAWHIGWFCYMYSLALQLLQQEM